MLEAFYEVNDIFSAHLCLISYGTAVGDTVSDIGTYVAEGVSVKWVVGYLQTSRANSTRLYDSNKGAEWTSTSKPDSLMCWLLQRWLCGAEDPKHTKTPSPAAR